MDLEHIAANALSAQQVTELTKQYILPSYSRFPLALKSAHGALLSDFEGNEYLDLTSGIGVNCLGGTNEHWIAEVTAQINTLAHTSNLYYTAPAAKLAARLCEKTGMRYAFFGNSGAEGNEGLIKLARKYSFDHYGTGRNVVVTLYDSFHGRTVTTLSATGQDSFHQYFFPFTEGFRFAKANDIDSVLKAVSAGDVCAVLCEPVLGEGGVMPLEKSFLQALSKLCNERDILLLLDEVQSGVGRTGSLFAFQQFGIMPDGVSFAKGIAGGLPMGGFLVGARCAETLGAGTHASTFGANPICAAAANAVLDTLDDNALQHVSEIGEYIKSEISNAKLPCVRAVRGMGLMIGIELDERVNASSVVTEAISRSLLVLTAKHNTVRLLPPLTITREQAQRAMDILITLLKEKM